MRTLCSLDPDPIDLTRVMTTSIEVNSVPSNESTPSQIDTPSTNGTVAALKTTFTLEELQQLLPHRYPFALVDRIIDYVPGKRAVGIKNVTFNEPHFQGHFPGRPIMPGVLIVEAMAQVGGVVLTQFPGMEGSLFLFAGIDKVRFRRQVIPGDQLVMTTELLRVSQRRIAKMQARAEVDGQLVTEGELLFSRVD